MLRIQNRVPPRTATPTKTTVADIVAGSLCAVTLIDRRTGSPARRNGTRLQVLTRNPQTAAADFLAGRDPLVWDVRIEPLDPARRT